MCFHISSEFIFGLFYLQNIDKQEKTWIKKISVGLEHKNHEGKKSRLWLNILNLFYSKNENGEM